MAQHVTRIAATLGGTAGRYVGIAAVNRGGPCMRDVDRRCLEEDLVAAQPKSERGKPGSQDSKLETNTLRNQTQAALRSAHRNAAAHRGLRGRTYHLAEPDVAHEDEHHAREPAREEPDHDPETNILPRQDQPGYDAESRSSGRSGFRAHGYFHATFKRAAFSANGASHNWGVGLEIEFRVWVAAYQDMEQLHQLEMLHTTQQAMHQHQTHTAMCQHRTCDVTQQLPSGTATLCYHVPVLCTAVETHRWFAPHSM
eukprot:641059-Rhodomonas_salina.3